MKSVAACFLIAAGMITFAAEAPAQESWQSALNRMPLKEDVTELNRTNCVPLLLGAFQSNAVVKGVVFMPGATDELYFFKRVHAGIPGVHPSLLNEVEALTNQTQIRATFQPPLLLLHTSEDALDPIVTIRSAATAARLHERHVPDRLIFNDADWDHVWAGLDHEVSVGLRPWSGSPDSWHFYRHSFAVCDVSEWELMEALAAANKTGFTVHWRTVTFKTDLRYGPVKPPEGLSR